jgi:hypothetical protein
MARFSTDIYLHGAEVAKWRRLLIEGQAQHVGLNFLYLTLPKSKPWLVAEQFAPRQSVLLDSGSLGVNKKGWTSVEHEEYFARYIDFVQANLSSLKLVVEADFLGMGLDWIEAQRSDFWDTLPPNQFVPVWHPEWGPKVLRAMIEKYPNVGVPPLDKTTESRVAGVVRSSDVLLHGLCLNHPFDLPGGLYNTVTSTSWISPSKWGETQVWDHGRMRRYSQTQKQMARRRHRNQFSAAGFNPERINNDEQDELTRYTIWAWQQMEGNMPAPRRTKTLANLRRLKATIPAEVVEAEIVDPDEDEVEIVEAEVLENRPAANGQRYLPAIPGDTKPLMPGLGFRTVKVEVNDPEAPNGMRIENELVPALADQSLRRCDSCSLREACPEFTPGDACHFSAAVEIRTKAQLMGALDVMGEMQFQRVMFARTHEEMIDGGFPSNDTSAEIDRFHKLVLARQKIEDNRDSFSMTISSKSAAGGGMLRNLFGTKAADRLHEVDPEAAEEALRSALRDSS